MKQHLTIPTELPALNEVIAESKRHYARYASLKREYTTLVAILAQKGLKPVEGRVHLRFDW